MVAITKNHEPMKSGFFIGIPFEKGTTEYENFKTMLLEIAHQNHDAYLVEECLQCEECGAINRTVDVTMVVGELRALCDYCVREYEE